MRIFLVILVVLAGCSGAEGVVNGNFALNGESFVTDDGEVIRLLCLDAPDRGERLYDAAQDRLNDYIAGRELRIRADVTDKDDEERLLRYVEVDLEDGTYSVNMLMIRVGLAIVKPVEPDTSLCSSFQAAQDKALAEGKFLWE